MWNLLDENRKQHNCNFWLLRGVISDKPAGITGTLYSTRSKPQSHKENQNKKKLAYEMNCGSAVHTAHDSALDNNNNTSVQVHSPYRHYSLESIQAITNLKVTALLIDCEGCIETLFMGNQQPLEQLLRGVNTIILEADMPIGALDCLHDCVDYASWIVKFKLLGLNVVYKQQDPIFKKIYHYVFRR